MPRSPFSESEMAVVRRAYARQMLALAGAGDDEQLERAFSKVRREDFLGKTPWRLSVGFGYRDLPSDDPVPLYQDVLLALAADRGVNNGSPSLHAKWLHAADLKEGDTVAHLGAGAGYYTAIISELVGESGRVTAIEVDKALAAFAKANLKDRRNTVVEKADGSRTLSSEFDCIYVNFAVEKPLKIWTDRLSPGGRLIFPLGVAEPTSGKANVWHTGRGAAFLVERKQGGLSVKWLGRALFVCAEGEPTESEASRRSLRASFEKPGIEFVRSLHWDHNSPPERNWHLGQGWRLCFDEVH
jgi:protein-L-isoaspartate(D-aspartate) O-methyltransferase